MRPLYLDFLLRRRHHALLGPVLLGVALLAAAALVAWTVALDRALEDGARRETERVRRDAAAQRPARAALSSEEQQRVAAALRQLTTPWEALLASVEKASNDDIAVLALEQDAAQSSLKLLAEARNPAAMLAYVRRIGAGGTLRSASLEAHKIDLQQPGQPVRFSITARYVAQP